MAVSQGPKGPDIHFTIRHYYLGPPPAGAQINLHLAGGLGDAIPQYHYTTAKLTHKRKLAR